MNKLYPNNYNEDEKNCFDEIRNVASNVGAHALIVENGSGYVLAEVNGDITDAQKNVAKDYNDGSHLLILDFVSDREKTKGDIYYV